MNPPSQELTVRKSVLVHASLPHAFDVACLERRRPGAKCSSAARTAASAIGGGQTMTHMRTGARGDTTRLAGAHVTTRQLRRLALATRVMAALCSLMMLAAIGGCAVSAQSTSLQAKQALAGEVRNLLDRYAADDFERVAAMLDDEFAIYGSDVSELVRTKAQLRALMDADFRLWHTASFGAVRDMDVRQDAGLAVATFHVPFSPGGRASVLVRMTTTWRHSPSGWKLTQLTSTVPTVGSSASELLKQQ